MRWFAQRGIQGFPLDARPCRFIMHWMLLVGPQLRRVPIPLVAAAMTLLLQASCADLTDLFDSKGLGSLKFKLGSDAFTWLPLVEARLETGNWSPFVASHNAPYGLETHLTRPFAELVLLLAFPLGLFLSPKDAALIAGMLSGPVLQMATAACVAWGAGAVLGPAGTLLAVVVFLIGWDLALHAVFSVYAYDHHALHLCLEAAVLALLLRHAAGVGGSGRMAGVAGVVAGVGIWAGTEMLLPAGVGGLALGLAWVIWGGDRRARALWLYALAMAAAIAGALIVERSPADSLSLELDRLSAAHVLMGALLALAASAVALTQRRWPGLGTVPRAMVAASAAVAAGIGLWIVIPDFLRGPYIAVDDLMQERLSGLIWHHGAGSLFAAAPDILGYFLLPFLLAVASAAQGLRTGFREAYLVLLVGVLSAAVFPFWAGRLVRHYILFTSIPLGGIAATLRWWLWNRASTGLRATAVLSVVGVMLSPHLGLIIGDLTVKKEATSPFWEAVADHSACDWTSLGRALARVPRVRGGTIATHPYHGDRVAYLSGLGVVATGCHCNEEGLADTLAILLSPADSARAVAERREVEFILQCPVARGTHGHDWYIERSGRDGLYARLARGEPPDWLTPVPEVGVDGFVVYRTTFTLPGSLNLGPSPRK